MASLLASFSRLLTPELVGDVGRAARLGGPQAQKGLEIMGPLVLGSLARKSESASGMASIMSLLSPGSTPGGPAGEPAAPAEVLTSVLGPGVSTISKVVGGRLGFDVKPLLVAATPAILGAICQMAKDMRLDPSDVARSLQQEHAAAMAGANSETRAVLVEAFRLSDEAAMLRARFSDAEWNTIRLCPLAVTLYVVTASPSGVRSIAREVTAATEGMRALVKVASPTSLVDVAFGSADGEVEIPTGGDLDTGSQRTAMLRSVRDAAALVKEKCPIDHRSFGQTLTALARKVAEASKEGGFLGMGGSLVSEQEERAIAEITTTVA
jgi:hypothetical protein